MNYSANPIYEYAFITSREIIDKAYLKLGGIKFDIKISEIRKIFISVNNIPTTLQENFIIKQLPNYGSVHSQYLYSFLNHLWKIYQFEKTDIDLILYPYVPYIKLDNSSEQDYFFQAKNSNFSQQEQDRINIKLFFGKDDFIPIQKDKKTFNKNIKFHPNIYNSAISNNIVKIISYLDRFIISNCNNKEEFLQPLYQSIEEINNIDTHESLETFFYGQLSHFILLSLYPFFTTKTSQNINFLEHTIGPCLMDYQNNKNSLVHMPSIEILLHSIFTDKSNPIIKQNYYPEKNIKPYWEVVEKSFYNIEEMIKYHASNQLAAQYNFPVFKELLPNLEQLSKNKKLISSNTDEKFLFNLFTFIIKNKESLNHYNDLNSIVFHTFLSKETLTGIVNILEKENIYKQIPIFNKIISKGAPTLELFILFNSLIEIQPKDKFNKIANILFNSYDNIVKALQIMILLPEQKKQKNFIMFLEHPLIIELFKTKPSFISDLLNYKIKIPTHNHSLTFFNQIIKHRDIFYKPKFSEILHEHQKYIKNFGCKNILLSISILENYTKEYIKEQKKRPTEDMFDRLTVSVLIQKLSNKTLKKIHLLLWEKYQDDDASINQQAIYLYSKINTSCSDNKILIELFHKKKIILPIKNIYSKTLNKDFFNSPQNIISYIIEPDLKNTFPLEPNIIINKTLILDAPMLKYISLQNTLIKNSKILSYLILMDISMIDKFSSEIQKLFLEPEIYIKMIKFISINNSNIQNGSRVESILKNIEKILDLNLCNSYFYYFLNHDKNINLNLRKTTIKENINQKLFHIFFENLEMEKTSAINTTKSNLVKF